MCVYRETLGNFAFFHTVFVFSSDSHKQICSANSINMFAFLVEIKYVLCEVETEFLYV